MVRNKPCDALPQLAGNWRGVRSTKALLRQDLCSGQGSVAAGKRVAAVWRACITVTFCLLRQAVPRRNTRNLQTSEECVIAEHWGSQECWTVHCNTRCQALCLHRRGRHTVPGSMHLLLLFSEGNGTQAAAGDRDCAAVCPRAGRTHSRGEVVSVVQDASS